ncbi:MAG: galactokinase [Verrucomicrobia bacterium]|nr:galactokinase [Verrucomicrobiota bacterium]MBI3869760.1 galactokinase [Verrucomicrobiota bacterium]
MPLHSLALEAIRQFTNHYGVPPACLAAAPGRVNLIGEHTDYNDGFVLPMAIDRYTVLAARPQSDPRIELISSAAPGQPASFLLSAPLAPGEPRWANYSKGVAAGFQNRQLPVRGFVGWVHSDVPLGGGLSSSASLEVATATALETLGARPLDPALKALICQEAEHRFAGVPCGIMDQFASVMAREDHLLLIDCRSRIATPAPMRDPRVAVLILNTNVKHDLASGAYAERRAQCETAARRMGLTSLRDCSMALLAKAASALDPLLLRRARHVVTENARTQQAVEAAGRNDWTTFGELMRLSHASLRHDYEVSCAELDTIVEAAEALGRDAGVYGCRMTGGGFGGCAVALVAREKVESVAEEITRRYSARTGIKASWFSSRPVGGARALDMDPL